jgi:hypothetical protein
MNSLELGDKAESMTTGRKEEVLRRPKQECALCKHCFVEYLHYSQEMGIHYIYLKKQTNKSTIAQ